MSVSVPMLVSLSMFVSVGVAAVFPSLFNAHVHSWSLIVWPIVESGLETGFNMVRSQ
jgi:hypothetical protein